MSNFVTYYAADSIINKLTAIAQMQTYTHDNQMTRMVDCLNILTYQQHQQLVVHEYDMNVKFG